MIPTRPLGNTGLTVSLLGYGGAPIGFSQGGNDADFVRLLHEAVDLGITFFDTAADYRGSEELLGTALRGRRQDVVIASKCGRIQTRSGAGWDVREDWSEEGVLRMVDVSLQRLDSDYIDLLQLHSPPLWVLENGDAIAGMMRVQEAGKVRHLGVSADGDEARLAIELDVFETLQISYSILQQEAGADILPRAASLGLGIIVKQPVANGIANLITRPEHPDWNWKWDVAQRMDWEELGAGQDRLDLALRWVLANPLVSTAIVGTKSIDHLRANVDVVMGPELAAATWRMAEDQYYEARRRIAEEGQQ